MPHKTFQNGRFIIDGKPYFVIASDYQYYRDPRNVWHDRLTQLKEMGVHVITFYTPWRHHLQIEKGHRFYDFTGQTRDNRDLVRFLEIVDSLGLRMIFKPGPFVHSELNVGGLPDLATPSLNPAIPALRRYDGSPVHWCYDNTILPAPLDPAYDQLARDWLVAVSAVVAPHAGPGGALLAIQLNDETIFCCSNDPPWRLGYEPSSMHAFHELLRRRYKEIDNYNRIHGTHHEAFDYVTGPQPPGMDRSDNHVPRQREDVLAYIDWAEHQWRLRRDIYVRYKEWVGIDVPYLTNFAGITPPIEENIPDSVVDPADQLSTELAKAYSDWWFAMNRIDQDADEGAYEYGMISWLGVASYAENVFDRYVNTARRRRGINMEENWGFAVLYDPRSRYPIVPVFQTLVSIAAGATGYDIYTGTSTDYWDDHLDRVTKKQCATFPSDAPIDNAGNPGVLYDAAAMLNGWFNKHGEALLACEPIPEAAYLLYAPYAAVASWIPERRYWGVEEHDLPRCGYQAFEPWSSSLQRAGYSLMFQELETATLNWMLDCQSVSIHVAFFMGRNEQKKLADFMEAGGRLFLSGELPSVDLELKPCSILKDAIDGLDPENHAVMYRRENLFEDGQFASRLLDAGIWPRVSCSDRLRVFVHYGEQDQFIFFFHLGEGSSNQAWLELDGHRIEMDLGSKTCGILRWTAGQIHSCFVKGHNEIDGTIAEIRIHYRRQIIEGRGDFVG